MSRANMAIRLPQYPQMPVSAVRKEYTNIAISAIISKHTKTVLIMVAFNNDVFFTMTLSFAVLMRHCCPIYGLVNGFLWLVLYTKT